MKKIRPDIIVDVRELISPVSLLKVENRLAEMGPGQMMEVWCRDEETESDLKDIMRNSNHRCTALKQRDDYARFIIEKKETGP